MGETTRREFLQASVIGTAAIVTGCGGPQSQPHSDGGGSGDTAADAAPTPDMATPALPVVPPESTPESKEFSLGIAAGDVESERALLWTRHAGSVALKAIVWEMNGDQYVRELPGIAVTRADGGFVKVDAPGLTAGARYRYAFMEMNGETRVARSAVGQFRAALGANDLQPLVFGATSCCLNGLSQATMQAAGADQLDAFLLLGDTSYNDDCATVDDYRARWQTNLTTDAHRAMRVNSSVIATWDDHEVENNWNPETVPVAQVAAARQTFFENLPVRQSATSPDRIWRKLSWGKTADVFVLDCRSDRLPSTRGTAQEQYLSRTQMDWFKSSLTTSTAMFKIIMNSVPIGLFPSQFETDDRWEGWPTARTEILSHIDDNHIGGVLWVSGDFHIGCSNAVAKTGLGSTQREVLVGPGAQVPNPLYLLVNGSQYDYAKDTNNYTRLHLDPATHSVRVVFIDGKGKSLFDKSYVI